MWSAKDLAISEQDYLDGEQVASVKHEYIDGQVYAMAGASKTHGILVLNLASLLRNHLRGKPCRSFVADMKVHLANSRRYYYPDLAVTCDPRDLGKQTPSEYYLEHPSVIVEVLSPTTERKDRFEKLVAYRDLPSLVEYVLVDQQRQWVEVFRRHEDGWLHQVLTAGDTLNLTAVDLQVPLAAVYEESDVPEQAAAEADQRYVEAYLRQPESVALDAAVAAAATEHWEPWK